MTVREMLDILDNFDEGCELTDAVGGLLSAAHILYGINEETKADIIVLLAKELIEEYLEWCMYQGEPYEFEQFDAGIFKLLKGLDKDKFNFVREL